MKKIFLIIFLILVLTPFLVQAQGLVPCGPGLPPPNDVCGLCHIFVLFQNIINFILWDIVPPLAILMITIAGFMFMFAGSGGAEVLPGGGKGGPAMLNHAKKIISSVLWGLLIIYGAWLIVDLLLAFPGLVSTTWGWDPTQWFTITCP